MKPFTSITLDGEVYRLRLTLGTIIDYEELTGNMISALNFSEDAEAVTVLLWLMLGGTLEDTIKKYSRLSEDDRVQIILSMYSATANSYPKSDGTKFEPSFFDGERCMKTAIEIGLKLKDLWDLTVTEFVWMQKEHVRKLRRAHNDRMSLAWHMAAFSNQKKLPDLKSLMVDLDDVVKKVQTADEMMAACKLMAVAFGGKVEEL